VRLVSRCASYRVCTCSTLRASTRGYEPKTSAQSANSLCSRRHSLATIRRCRLCNATQPRKRVSRQLIVELFIADLRRMVRDRSYYLLLTVGTDWYCTIFLSSGRQCLTSSRSKQRPSHVESTYLNVSTTYVANKIFRYTWNVYSGNENAKT